MTAPAISEAAQARIAALEAKLAAREGKPGFASNVDAIKAEIVRLQAGGKL